MEENYLEAQPGQGFWNWGNTEQNEPDPPERWLVPGEEPAGKPMEAHCPQQAEPQAEMLEDSVDSEEVISLELADVMHSVSQLGKRLFPSLVKGSEWQWDQAEYKPGYGLPDLSEEFTRADIAEEIATSFGGDLIDVMSEYEKLDDKYRKLMKRLRPLSDQLEQLKEENAQLRQENGALLDQIERLRRARTRQVKSKCVIPAQKIVVNSRVHQHILQLIGEEGLGRSWQIRDRVVELNGVEERSVTNAMTKLTKKGLIEDYNRDGRSVRWKCTAGGSRRLILLTERGSAWYREAYGQEPVESEIVRTARVHRSAVHGVGVLEARDHLQAAGYTVDDDPDAILEYEDEQWRRRVEPDLIVQMDGKDWPVEVQREVSERLLQKWEKALALAGRLALVLFNVAHRERQAHVLRRAKRLPRGTICLTSLEEMEAGDWSWVIIESPVRR